MKIAGIILLVIGGMSTLGAMVGAAQGHSVSPVGGLAFVALGAFLLSRANKKKKEAEEKIRWAKGKTDESE